jgi:hypothetical protein
VESYDDAKIFFWDGVSETYNFFIDVPEGAINAMKGSQGTLSIIAGYKGDLLEYSGGDKAIKVKRLPKLESDKKIEVLPGAMTMWQTLLRIGAGVTDSSAVEQGVYTWGSLTVSYPPSLSYDYTISTGNSESSDIKIGMVIPVEKKLLIGWKDNVSYGVDSVDIEGDPYATGSVEFVIKDEEAVWKEKLVTVIRADFEELNSGESVGVQYKLDRDATWSIGETENTADAVELRHQVTKSRHREYQVRLNMATSTTTSPAVLGVTVNENILENEKKL